MKFLRYPLVLTLAAMSTACFGLDNLFDKLPTSPSSSSSNTTRSYLGTWVAPALATFATPQTCGSAQWKITSQNATQINGDFSASCAGGVLLAGTVVGSISSDATSIPWAASGTATQGSTSCAFSLTGTGTFQGTSNIALNYTGTSCLGPVTGGDTITR